MVCWWWVEVVDFCSGWGVDQLLCRFDLLAGRVLCCLFFFFNDTATTEIYTLSLHDALPISFQKEQEPLQTGLSKRNP